VLLLGRNDVCILCPLGGLWRPLIDQSHGRGGGLARQPSRSDPEKKKQAEARKIKKVEASKEKRRADRKRNKKTKQKIGRE
jgi:hypothetical protein